MFVAFEGVDGCGKSTQAELLRKTTENAVLFKFPNYETPIGRAILAHLKGHWTASIPREFQEYPSEFEATLDPLVFQSIQMANRLESVFDLQKEKVAGKLVIADRYLASGLVYGALDGLDYGYMHKIQEALPQPDLHILIDVDVQDSFDRRPERRDRYEADISYMSKVAQKYRDVFSCEQAKERENSPRWVTINGRKEVQEVAFDIREEIKLTRTIRSFW